MCIECTNDIAVNLQHKIYHKTNTWILEQIQIELNVSIHSDRCSLKEDVDTLTISSTKDMSANKHEFTGTSASKWNGFRIPGEFTK